MNFLHRIFGNKQAPARREPAPKSQPSPQLALLQTKGDEKLSLLRYLATCGQMDATKLEAYLSIFESFGNELGPEKKAYILKSAPMMALKLEGGRVLNGYERLRWSFFQTHIATFGNARHAYRGPAHSPLYAPVHVRAPAWKSAVC